MLKKSCQMDIEHRDNMRGGQGTVELQHLFKNELPVNCRLLARITLPEGASIGYHTHDNETEIYYFLKGKGTVDDNGEKKSVSAGDALHTGGGKGHAVFNTGSGDLEFMAVIIKD
ncbi:MAG TPA: cupin domain-containing protein [Clostridiales bacterium]|nr:cupin domain-containing protein [Clostridiales bacterium]